MYVYVYNSIYLSITETLTTSVWHCDTLSHVVDWLTMFFRSVSPIITIWSCGCFRPVNLIILWCATFKDNRWLSRHYSSRKTGKLSYYFQWNVCNQSLFWETGSGESVLTLCHPAHLKLYRLYCLFNKQIRKCTTGQWQAVRCKWND